MNIYKFISKLLKIILNLSFLVQITLMILVFFTAAYWFFSLINSNLFMFAAPLAEEISNFIKYFYDRNVEIYGVYIDATLLLFDVIAIGVVIIISKFKFYIYRAIESVDYLITVQYRKAEKLMNEEMQREVEDFVRKYKNAVVVLEFDAKDMHVDSFWGGDAKKGVDDKINEALKIFYSTAKTLKNCTFAKTDNKIAVMIDDFEKFDDVMVHIEQILNRIRDNMSKINWEFITYMVADVYYDNTDFKYEVYPKIKKLLNLKYKNQVMCYGNFYLRYNLLPESCYYLIQAKGNYQINEVTKIYSLVKKN